MAIKNVITRSNRVPLTVMDNKDVIFGYRYWVTYFMDMVMDILRFENLPETLPQEEIMKRLIIGGFAVIFKHPVEGIITCNANLYNYDIYDRYLNYTVYNPFRTFFQGLFTGSNKIIGKDGIVIYATGTEKYVNQMPSDNLMYNTIKRYARMMADIESTLSAEMITQRMPFMPVASNQQTYESVISMFGKLEEGKLAAIIDSDFLKDMKIMKNKDLVANYLSELINARKNILSMFYSEIGMYAPDSKRERLIADEVENGQNNMKTLIYSMLREVQKGVEAYNKFFNSDVTVSLRNVLYNKEIDINDMSIVDQINDADFNTIIDEEPVKDGE